MANCDTVAALFGPGTGRNQINALTVASTTETVFVVSTDTSTITNAAVLTVPSGNGTNLVGSGSPVEFNQNSAISSQSFGRKVGVGTEQPYFSKTTFDAGRPFHIRIAGNATLASSTTNTLVLAVYAGTSTATTSDTKVSALTAGGAAGTSVNFFLDTVVSWDSVSQVLGGYYIGQCGNTLTAAHALSSAASVTSASGLTFVVSATFGTAAGGTVNLVEFSCDQL